MAASSSIPDQGFFSSAGVLRSEGIKSPSGASSESTSTSSAGVSTSISDQTAQATASAITDAVVVRITSQLNVGETGFDSGVADKVREAVSSALNKLSSQQAAPFTPREIGGTYQNEILAQGKQPPTPPPVSVTPTPTPLPPPKESAPPKEEDDDEVRKLAKRYVDRKSKRAGRSQSNEERDREVENVREFYSRGDRRSRLKALVDEGEE